MSRRSATDLVADWRYEVANGDTKLGLTEWIAHQLEMERVPFTDLEVEEEP